MPTRNRWMISSLTGLLLAAAAGLAYAAASEAEAAGVDLAEALDGADASEGSDAAPEVRRSQIRLVLDRDGSAERLELTDLHAMAVGESRSLATESGTPVVVTRDEQGFEIDLDGRKIRLMDHFSGEPEGGSWTSADGTTRQFHKRVVVHDGALGADLPDAEAGGTNVMILRNKVAVDEGDGGKVVVMRRTPGSGGDAHAFAFTTEGGELPALPVPIEATIRRLEASPKFQELDEATRARVIEALRETAPKAGAFVTGEPGARTIVLEIEDEDGATEAN